MRQRGDFYFFLVLILIAVLTIGAAVMMERLEARLLPILFGGAILLLATIGLVREIKAGNRPGAPVSKNEAGETVSQGDTDQLEEIKESWPKLLLHAAWIVGFLLSIYVLGFIISIPLFVISYMRYMGTRWLTGIISAVAATAVAYFGFEVGLEVELHPGLLLTWLSR